MGRTESVEAAPIMDRALKALLEAAPTRGREGADLRSACSYLRARAESLIQSDAAGPPLAACFELAVKSNITQKQVAYVRVIALAETPRSVGAILIRDSIVQMCLATEGQVIAGMKFKSRDEVDKVKTTVNNAFAPAEELAADAIDAMGYRGLISLHAAVIEHLTRTAYPLPRMLNFRFAWPMPTLVLAHRLYCDASRADELREENKVIHPAFAQPNGRALSA